MQNFVFQSKTDMKNFNQKMLAALKCGEFFAAHLSYQNKGNL